MRVRNSLSKAKPESGVSALTSSPMDMPAISLPVSSSTSHASAMSFIRSSSGPWAAEIFSASFFTSALSARSGASSLMASAAV